MSDLASDPGHGGVTDVDLERFFADHPNLAPLGQGVPSGGGEGPSSPAEPPSPPPPPPPPLEPEPGPSSTQPPPEAPPEGEPGPAPDTAIPEPPPASPNDFYDLAGVRYPRSQLEAAAAFQQHLATDPQLQRLITDYLTGATQPPPQQQPAPQPLPTVPDEYLEDPGYRALYTLIQAQNDQINQLNAGLRTTYDTTIAAQRNTINGQWETAAASFAHDHDLDRADVDRLGQVAARLNVLPQLMAPIDPVTGAPRQPDPIRAFDQALTIAMYQLPEYRDREFRRSVETQQQEAHKRKLLGAVGGSSGSVSRTQAPPKPGSPEAQKAMLAEVSSMLTGEWSDPTAN